MKVYFTEVFLFQIDEVLKDTNKAELFAEHVDQFLVVCTLQLRMVYSKHMGDADMDKDSIVRLYKCLLATMLAVSSLLFKRRHECKIEHGHDLVKPRVLLIFVVLLMAYSHPASAFAFALAMHLGSIVLNGPRLYSYQIVVCIIRQTS